MFRTSRTALFALLCAVIPGGTIHAQSSTPAHTAAPSASAEHAIGLAEKGHCEESLAILKKLNFAQVEQQLRYRAHMAAARCAMSLGEDQTTLNSLMALRREFPKDPQVLYITTHFLSEMSLRIAQELAAVAPSSYQAQELEAEAAESQNRWEDAAAIYKKILEDNPQVPGVHFRLGRVALSLPESTANVEEAKKQFEQELTVDPLNAAAEFWLGEIARRNGQWDEAIARFTHAASLDPGFAEADLALGISLNSAERYQDAVPPLERYVKMVAADPAGHYQLSIAYARSGRKSDAVREMSIQQQLGQKKNGTDNAPQNRPQN